jgi:hypothetical protein
MVRVGVNEWVDESLLENFSKEVQLVLDGLHLVVGQMRFIKQEVGDAGHEGLGGWE